CRSARSGRRAGWGVSFSLSCRRVVGVTACVLRRFDHERGVLGQHVEVGVTVEDGRTGADRDSCDQAVGPGSQRSSAATAGAKEGRGELLVKRLIELEETAACQEPSEVSRVTF